MKDSLARIQTVPAMTLAQLDALGARAWMDHGIVVLKPIDVPNPAERQVITTLAEQRYGPRQP